ncbi:hypothetical protein QIH85_41085 [Bradyrhizobium japonicum]|uniref:hypothetical protein n=1 Tax=Bradyrhizobium japonicum TaxID=375 RepID=UPI002714AE8B|nr:hypothetical protein [Bradyrhizobium japonicum]WLB28140.1 hypothetical protein QIH85_41085 [Bradyrhizobium japonicum]
MKKDYRSGSNRSINHLNPDGGTWNKRSADRYEQLREEGEREHVCGYAKDCGKEQCEEQEGRKLVGRK